MTDEFDAGWIKLTRQARISWIRENTMTTKDEAYAALKAAAEKFVEKVETGRARSVETYNEMKAALVLIEAAE